MSQFTAAQLTELGYREGPDGKWSKGKISPVESEPTPRTRQQSEGFSRSARLSSVLQDSVGVSTDEAKLNKTEKAFLVYLRAQHSWVGIQCITLKLADDCRYTCDFWTQDVSGRLHGWEVKGFRREDAMIKLKVAARIYGVEAGMRFTLVERQKGDWKFTEVKP